MELTKEQILGSNDPSFIFSMSDYQSSYKNLAKKWHPDSRSGDTQVFQHIKNLKDQLDRLMLEQDQDIYHTENLLFIKKASPKIIPFFYSEKTPLVSIFCSSTFNIISYDIPYGIQYDFMCNDDRQGYIDFARDMAKTIFTVDSKNTNVIRINKENSIEYIHITEKDKYLLPLNLFLNGENSKYLTVPHCAWITTQLFNIACLCRASSIPITTFEPLIVALNPKEHLVKIVSPLVYSIANRNTLRVNTLYSSYYFNSIPSFKRTKRDMFQLENYGLLFPIFKLIKSLYINPITKTYKEGTTKEIQNWLNSPISDNSLNEMKRWEQVRESLGQRKFVDLVLPDSIYTQGKG